jgi:hypothetical protein
LIDGAFVGVLVEGAEPIQALAVPRAAVAQDQQGAFVYALDKENKVQQRRVQLGAGAGGAGQCERRVGRGRYGGGRGVAAGAAGGGGGAFSSRRCSGGCARGQAAAG